MTLVTVQAKAFDVDAAIFDLDGTLIDTMGDFSESLNRMLAELGLPSIEHDSVSRMVGKGSEHLLVSTLNHVLTRSGKAPEAIEIEALYAQAWPSYQRHYAAVNGQFARIFPGVPECLDALENARMPLICATNKPTAFAMELLRQFEMLSLFRHVFGADAFEKKKPDPMPLLRSCEVLGTTPARTLMVGDSANDAQAARAAGCPVLLVTYGYNHGDPVREVDADAWTDTLSELQIKP